MIIFIYSLLLIVSLALTYLKYHTVLRVNFIYTLLWGLGAILVSTGYGGLFSITEEVHLYIILSIIVFNFVYLTGDKRKKYFFQPRWELPKITFQILSIAQVLSFVVMIPIMITAIQIIIKYGWFELRDFAYGESELASNLQMAVYTWLINPLYSVTLVLTSILIFSNSKYTKWLFVFSFIDLILITVTFGGRYNIFKFVLFFISAYILNRQYNNKQKRLKFRYVLLIILIIIIVAFLTSLRGLKQLSFIQNAVFYLYGSFVYLGMIIADSYSPLNSVKMYGNATLGFITSIPMYLLYRITGINNTPEYLIDLTSNEFLYISSTHRYNSFTTWLFPFWKDFGVFGIIIGVAFIVISFIAIKNLLKRKKKLIYFALLVYLYYVVLSSTLTYNLITIQHSVTLILLYLLTKNAIFIGGNYGQEKIQQMDS